MMSEPSRSVKKVEHFIENTINIMNEILEIDEIHNLNASLYCEEYPFSKYQKRLERLTREVLENAKQLLETCDHLMEHNYRINKDKYETLKNLTKKFRLISTEPE